MRLLIFLGFFTAFLVAPARVQAGDQTAPEVCLRLGADAPLRQSLFEVPWSVAQGIVDGKPGLTPPFGADVQSTTTRLVRVWLSGQGASANIYLEIGANADDPDVEFRGGMSGGNAMGGSARVGRALRMQGGVEVAPNRVHFVHEQEVRFLRVRLPNQLQLVGYADTRIQSLGDGQGYSITSVAPGSGVAFETADESVGSRRLAGRPRFRLSMVTSPGVEVRAGQGARPSVALAGVVFTGAELSF